MTPYAYRTRNRDGHNRHRSTAQPQHFCLRGTFCPVCFNTMPRCAVQFEMLIVMVNVLY